MSDLDSGLAASANSPSAESTPTVDATLDAAFDTSSEGAAPSEPSTPADPETQPVAATLQPQEPAKPETGVKGEPPREKWDQILANARTKEREAALAEHKEALEIVAELKRDFPGTLARLLDEGVADQRFADQLTSRAAAILSARRKASAEDAEPQPDVQWQAQDGSTVSGYSAEQMRKWQTWNARTSESKILEQFKPLQELQQRFQSAEQFAKASHEAQQIAEKKGATWKSMPFFAEHSDAILKRQQELYESVKDQPGFDPVNAPWDLLQEAYREVVTSQALPKLHATQTEKLMASAAHKRAGSTADPSSQAPATPRKPRTPDEALDQVFDAAFAS